MARCNAARPSGSDSIDFTEPTWAPCSFTFAPVSITRPARCDSTVTGTVLVKLPRKNPRATATVATATATVVNPNSIRRAFEVVAISAVPPLARQVEVAVGSVDRQRHQQCHRDHDDQ